MTYLYLIFKQVRDFKLKNKDYENYSTLHKSQVSEGVRVRDNTSDEQAMDFRSSFDDKCGGCHVVGESSIYQGRLSCIS